MFIFLIPRTPISHRNSLREQLWLICKESLIRQTCKDWKAIIIGDTSNEQLDNKHFVCLNFDNFDKISKLKKALELIENWKIKPEYLIRLDDDDIISTNFLTYVESLPQKFDCYFDEWHSYIDLVYLKRSHKKNSWMPNTVIHSYFCAIETCGKQSIPLILQNHDEYWHIYYKNKRILKSVRSNPLYYRILSPYSITSLLGAEKNEISWEKHLIYLNGYGPWLHMKTNFFFYKKLKEISENFFYGRPYQNKLYWIFNQIKFIKVVLINIIGFKK